MVSKYKKLAILAGVFVFGALVFFLLRQSKVPVEQDTKISDPSLPNSFGNNFPLTTTISSTSFNFPKELPLIGFKLKQIDLSFAQDIAKRLGIPGAPNVVNDVNEGQKYIWGSQEGFLFITPAKGSISYGLANVSPPETANKQLNDDDIKKAALTFLTDKIQIPSNLIQFESIEYLVENPTTEGFADTTKQNASVYQVNFTLAASGYPVLSIVPGKPITNVRILPDGSIFSAEVAIYESIEIGNNLPILTFDEFSKRLPEANLVSFTERVDVTDNVIKTIRNISVEAVSLVYLFDGKNLDYLQPVFLLEGIVQTNTTQILHAQLYLPALQNR